jgi:predicted alpha/beta superfamily hydrolase
MNAMRSNALFLSFILICLISNLQIKAQSNAPDSPGKFTLNNIDTWPIHSEIIKDDFTLYVLRTAAYDTTNIQLPVLYMTDGDWNMTVAMNCFSMLRQDYETREPLIVGIGYGKGTNQRVRDLDPAKGGPAFLSFIEKEVMPFIAKNYRTTDEKAIYGYSMGGMFTTYILFNRPDLFNMIFIGAPGNNGRLLMDAAQNYFKDHKDLKSKVFIGVGSYERETVKNIDSFSEYLLSLKCPGLTIRKEITPGCGHGAALSHVMQNAVAFGYCVYHVETKINTDIYNQYKGKYTSDNKAVPDLQIFTEKNKLYWKMTGSSDTPFELIPFSKTEFFMTENQRVTFTFREEKNKFSLLVVPDDKKEYFFTRVE